MEPPLAARQHLRDSIRVLDPDEHQVEWLTDDQWSLRLASFGHVSLGDLNRIQDGLSEVTAATTPFTLRLARVVPLPEDGDDSVWVEVAGGNAPVELSNRIAAAMRHTGFFLDRRSFRPRIRLARVGPQTTVEFLERVVSELGNYRGPAWTASQVTLAIRRRDTESGHARLIPRARLPLGKDLHATNR